MIKPLHKDDLYKQCNQKINQLMFFDVVESTNDVVKHLHKVMDKTLIIARHQTKGRGTQQRVFYSAKDKGIYASYIRKIDNLPFNVSFLPMVMACAVVKLCLTYNITPSIKWVNDITIKNKKCAGILCETFLDNHYVVIGVGINVVKQLFSEDIMDIATSLKEHGKDIHDLNIMVGQLINYFNELCLLSTQQIITMYKTYCLNIEKNHLIKINNTSILAKAKEIDEKGRLVLTDQNSTYQLVSTTQILNIY